MARRVPEGPPPPPIVQRVRLRYAKRGRLRFTSHRDFARAFERALRRGNVPMAYSAGFSPHPKISYLGAAPTGVASEAEYLEIGLATRMDVEELRVRIDEALPEGLDIVEAVESAGGSLAEQMQASSWEIQLPGVTQTQARAAVEAFLAQSEVPVERLTKDGRRTINARGAVLAATVHGASAEPEDENRAILALVVRQETPAVRPDDVLAALRSVAGLALALPPLAVRLAQGPLDESGVIGDPLAADRAARQSDS
ncbi:radical SAM-linked protein [Frankineae bacterium MT45]|nr:radical SAM-linked protein [Frankineae bacterium MT45]